MTGRDLVGPSREGDQFHYHWAARLCLGLLPGGTDLVAVTIEGPSEQEGEGDEIEAGEELIDVGLYYGSEERDKARLVRYVQLKHSTRRALKPWTISGLRKTIGGFAERYSRLVEHFPADDVAQRFRFEFTTTRPINRKVKETLADLASGAAARHPDLHQRLVHSTGLNGDRATDFFSLFSATGEEEDLWVQRNLLMWDVSAYLPDADYDAPVQLKELVTRKATTEFKSNPSIRQHDVLRALKVTEEQLQPAPCLIANATNSLPRDQEKDILQALLSAEKPLVIHADPGVGKSVLAGRLAASIPPGSVVVLYDCFGDGLYRNALHFRHRHRDALVQIANELAAQGLCHALIPTAHADTKLYMRAFLHRLAQVAGLLRARDPQAHVCLIIDAADNAEMAADELREPASFVRDLIRAPLPDGVCLALTCRTHRRGRLEAPPDVQEIELYPFSKKESARHLRAFYPSASDADVAEFAFLTSDNPRLQALALSRDQPLQEMLKQLGPTPMTVDRAIGELLESAIDRLRDEVGALEAEQIEVICQALAVLRPLIPIAILARLSQTSESAVRSFALDLGRPLFLKGESLHFLDEPAETWFREHFQPDSAGIAGFVERLRPLTPHSSYAAAALPQLLLQAGRLNEVVDVALSGEGLPTGNPLERRDVELQRLTFALKACLEQRRYMDAAKLALRAGGESAGEKRQNDLIQQNTDLAAVLMAPDRIDEIVSRGTFGTGWMGSRHAYDAGLLSGRAEFSAEASSRLRMALDWLRTWARLPDEQRQYDEVTEADRAELAMALLRLRGPDAAASFLRSWTPRYLAFEAGGRLGRRLIELGQYEQLNALSRAAGNDVWLLLGLAAEARAVGCTLPAAPLARLIRLLGDRRVKLAESQEWNSRWIVLYAVRSAVELALRVLPPEPEAWAEILRRYLPPEPPSDLASRFGFARAPLLRTYALEAALRGQSVAIIDVAPPDVRTELEAGNQYGRSEETEIFQQEVGGLLSWSILSAEIACGRTPSDLARAIEAAIKETSSAADRNYRGGNALRQTAALEWLQILRDMDGLQDRELAAFRSWLAHTRESLWPNTLISLSRCVARVKGFESLALDFAIEAYQALESSREDAESRANSYVELARAILVVSSAEAGVYFDRAVEIASRIGEENLYRWTALLHLATAAGERDNPRPRTAYRLSRIAELTYEYVVRDKHFDWERTVESLTDLCARSALSILSRWRDRRFGVPGRLLPVAVYRLLEQGQLPAVTPVAFAGLEAEWKRLSDIKRVVATQAVPQRSLAAQIAYRYLRVQPWASDAWSELSEVGSAHGLDFPDLDRLIAISRKRASKQEENTSKAEFSGAKQVRRSPDWDAIFQGVELTNADALRSAYAAVRTYDPPYEFGEFFGEAFARVRVGKEPELVCAIAAWPDFGIFELRHLLDALPSPVPRQVSFRSAVRKAVLSACRREPERVQRRGWGALIPFEELDANGLVPDGDVVDATLEGFTAKVHMLDASEFFRMVDPLAARVSPNEANEALNFGLDLLEDVLRPEDGDGPWRPELEPPQSLVFALGGYIWAGLGSPVVAERWQYAHVVRSVIELGWTELLEAVIAWAKQGNPGPFVDQGLEFYVWHARQWLLIGLARGGLDNAASLRPAVPLLQLWFREEHVLIRELAARALRALVTAGELRARDAGDFASVNRPRLPEEVYTGWLAPVEDEELACEETLSDEQKYYFGIDIRPYWFGPLGRSFGLTENAIERWVRHALRRHLGWSGVEARNDARYRRRIFNDRETYHSHGSLPDTDDLRAYHSYHGMMLAAAVLLQQRRARRRAEEAENEFQQWLADHLLTRTDGRWLADRRDPRLALDPPAPEGYHDKLWCWSVTAGYLDQQLVTDDGWTVLWGHWSGGDTDHTETVVIRSALVCKDGADALLGALQTAPELDRFALPSAAEREDLQAGSLRLTGWVVDEGVAARLDSGDPWAESLHYPGPAPSNDTIAKLGLAASADGRAWLAAGDDGLLRSETWTHIQGYGREAETIPGWRFSGDQRFLKRLLDAHPEDRLLLSVEIRRRPPRRSSKDEFEPYRWLYARYYLMGDDGVAHTL